MNTEITLQQRPKDGIWIDENGAKIPFNRTTKSERLKERAASKILKEASYLNTRILKFKDMVRDLCEEAYDAFMAEKDVAPKKTKGNFTWFNFNRTIKVEVNVTERIEFDDLTIVAAKAKLDEFLEEAIASKNEFAKKMVLDAFETSKNNKLDVKKVMQLTSYEKRINDPVFSEAVKLITEAIRRPSSKTYFRIWKKDTDGSYQNIDLNFSSI